MKQAKHITSMKQLEATRRKFERVYVNGFMSGYLYGNFNTKHGIRASVSSVEKVARGAAKRNTR